MLSGKSMSPGRAGTRWSVFRGTLGPVLFCLLGLAVEVYTLAFRTTTHIEANGAQHVLVKEFGARLPITQTFQMRSDGLEGVRIRLASSARCDIALDWLLSERQPPAAIVPLHGKRLQLRSVSGERWAVVRFPAIAHSMGRTYSLEVRAFDVRRLDRDVSPDPATDGPALVASVDDALPGSVLAVGGQERSGDLVFDTIALGDTILGRLMLSASWSEGPPRLVWLVGAAIVLHNILLAVFVIHFWSRTRTVPEESGSREQPDAGQTW
jgi:hypothetical protein